MQNNNNTFKKEPQRGLKHYTGKKKEIIQKLQKCIAMDD